MISSSRVALYLLVMKNLLLPGDRSHLSAPGPLRLRGRACWLVRVVAEVLDKAEGQRHTRPRAQWSP